MKTNSILIIACILAVLVASITFHLWKDAQANVTRLNKNFIALSHESTTKDSIISSVLVMSLKVDEIKKAFPALAADLKKEMGINIKNALQVQQTGLVINQTYKTTLKDSIVLDSIPLEYFTYQDDYKTFSAEKIDGQLFVTHDITRVPLLQVIHKETWRIKNILPWNWNTRAIVQDVKSLNPHAYIDYNRVINVTK